MISFSGSPPSPFILNRLAMTIVDHLNKSVNVIRGTVEAALKTGRVKGMIAHAAVVKGE